MKIKRGGKMLSLHQWNVSKVNFFCISFGIAPPSCDMKMNDWLI